jgi:hypothetical protein
MSVEQITNIKLLHTEDHDEDVTFLMQPHAVLCNKIISALLQPSDHVNLLAQRDLLYDLFIYNLDISECIWYILNRLIQDGHLEHQKLPKLLLQTLTFFKYYNNNYRPIYHLEHYMLQLMAAVNPALV